MSPQSIWKYRFSSRLQAFALVTTMAAMLGLTGYLLGGLSMALSISLAVMALYWLQPLLAPRLMLRIQGGRPLAPPEAPDLYGIIGALSREAGLSSLPRVYYLRGDVMNAFTVGTRSHAIIGITDGLLQHLNRDELAAVLAHEIAHLKNEDTRVMGFAALLNQLIHGLSLFGQLLLLVHLPLILAGHQFLSLNGILMLILTPYAGLLLQMALSRSREFLADMDAALLTSAHPLASALVKIERHNTFLKRRILRWPLVKLPGDSLLRTHPPTRERVRRLMALGAAREPSAALPARAPGFSQAHHPLRLKTRLDRCRAFGYCH